jgi:hypothetical protein
MKPRNGRGLASTTWPRIRVNDMAAKSVNERSRAYTLLPTLLLIWQQQHWTNPAVPKKRTTTYSYLRHQIICKASKGSIFLAKFCFNFGNRNNYSLSTNLSLLEAGLSSFFSRCASFTIWLLGLQPNVHCIKRTSHFGRTC